MRINFDDVRRPARMSKLVRTAFAANGIRLGLSGAQGVCARLYGHQTYHELKASCGRHPASPWDESCLPGVVSERRAHQLAVLVAAGLPASAATAFVDDNRPTGTGRKATAAVQGPARGAMPPRIPASEEAVLSDRIMESLLRAAVDRGMVRMTLEERPGGFTVTMAPHAEGDEVRSYHGTATGFAVVMAQAKDRARLALGMADGPIEGSFQYEYEDAFYDVHVLVTPSGTRETLTLEVTDRNSKLERLIGDGTAWRKGITRRNGLCLISGVTGSGKTTALNRSVSDLDRFGRKIFTAEDPVECRIPYVGQVSMNSGVGYGFAKAIRNFMKPDPDVMVLGEIRDADTARNAVKAAETGHLVIVTLNAASEQDAVRELIRFGIGPHELRFVLRAILHLEGRREEPDAARCIPFGAYTDFDAFIARMSGRGNALPVSLIDDAIARLKAGEVTSDQLRTLFGRDFDLRMEELGLDPDDYGRRAA